MAKLNQVVQCSCCGADVTAPQFFKGKAYGWSCVLKVAGKGFKRSRDNGYWVKAEKMEVKQPNPEQGRFKVVATIVGGIRLAAIGYMNTDLYLETDEVAVDYKSVTGMTEDGYVRLTKTKGYLSLKGDDTFKSTDYQSIYTKDGGLYHESSKGMAYLQEL